MRGEGITAQLAHSRLPQTLPSHLPRARDKSSHLFGFDDRPVQFNFASDLETSNCSICSKQKKL